MHNETCTECGTPMTDTAYGWSHTETAPYPHRATLKPQPPTPKTSLIERVRRFFGACDHPADALKFGTHRLTPEYAVTGYLCRVCDRIFESTTDDSWTWDDPEADRLVSILEGKGVTP